MTVLWLTVPPAFCNVEPKMARKTIGAITLLKAKKYWILAGVSKICNRSVEHQKQADSYLSVRNAQEGYLKQEVEHETTHSCRGDALAFRNMVWNIGKTWPNGCKQYGHTLTTSCGLDALYGQSSEASRDNGLVRSTYPSQTIARTHRDKTTK